MTPEEEEMMAMMLGKSLMRLSDLIDFQEREFGQRVFEDSVFEPGSALSIEAEYLANAMLHLKTGKSDFTPEQLADANKVAVHWIGHIACIHRAAFAAIPLVYLFVTRDKSEDASLAEPATT